MKLKKNAFMQGAIIATLGIVITKILGIVYVIPFYSIIGEENISLYGYAYTIYNLFLSLSTVGIPPAMSKLISEYNTLKYYYTKEKAYKIGKKLLIILGLILFIIMFFGAPLIAERVTDENAFNLMIGNIKTPSTKIVSYSVVDKINEKEDKLCSSSNSCFNSSWPNCSSIALTDEANYTDCNNMPINSSGTITKDKTNETLKMGFYKETTNVASNDFIYNNNHYTYKSEKYGELRIIARDNNKLDLENGTVIDLYFDEEIKLEDGKTYQKVRAIVLDTTGGNSKESIAFVIRIISTAILVVPYLSITKGYLQGHKILSPSSISQVIEQVVRITIIIVGSYLFMKVFKLGVTKSVGIAVFGATVGAVAAQSYLLIKMKKNKEVLITNAKITNEEKNIKDKDIIKKLLIYSVPFVSFGLALSIYDYIDMTTIVKTLRSLGFSTKNAETILGVLNTTGNKLNSVVLAISTGLMTSLVPTITSSFVKKDMEDIRNKVSQSFLMLLYVTLPMTVGLSFLAKPVYYAFYKSSTFGPIVFGLSIFVALFRCMFTTSVSIAQSLNKYKNVIISIVMGIITKCILQIPLMKLYSVIGLRPFWGATTATLIGLGISVLINIYVINKTVKLEFKKFFKKLFKFVYPLILMIIILLIMKNYIPFDEIHSRTTAIKLIAIYGLVGVLVYVPITIKNGIVYEIFGIKKLSNLLKRRRG